MALGKWWRREEKKGWGGGGGGGGVGRDRRENRDVINFSYRLGTSAFGRLRSATPLIISGSSFFLLVSSTLRLTCLLRFPFCSPSPSPLLATLSNIAANSPRPSRYLRTRSVYSSSLINAHPASSSKSSSRSRLVSSRLVLHWKWRCGAY